MTEPIDADPDRHARWVAMWREAVETSSSAMAVVELPTATFIALSAAAADLLGTTPQAGIGRSYLSVTERPQVAEETFRMAREGIIEGVQGWRKFRRSDGSLIEMLACGTAIRSPGPALGLWIA